MADCKYSFDEIRFDVRDPEITHVWVFLSVDDPTGMDCPHMVAGWHHKKFPASISTLDLHKHHVKDAVMWASEAPPDCPPVQPSTAEFYNKLLQSLDGKPC